MKSPAELARQLARVWEDADSRVQRLLSADGWPWVLRIGLPSARRFADDPAAVRVQVTQWRAVSWGEVQWRSVSYRAASAPVELPEHWVLRTPSEWVAACADARVRDEFQQLAALLAQVDPAFRALLLREKRLVLERPAGEVIRACQIALQLQPGCAGGLPLRALALEGCDSKFFERNRALLVRLLRQRFTSEFPSGMALEVFLGAAADEDHWLLLVALEEGLLPWSRLRVSTRDLHELPPAITHVLLVENERCLHQLPALPGTLAILGAGRDLGWLAQLPWQGRVIGYWGDLDSWGLLLLAMARQHCPALTALLMDAATLAAHPDQRVAEPVSAGLLPPDGLTAAEQQLYCQLQDSERGRLEQEFLAADWVAARLRAWRCI